MELSSEAQWVSRPWTHLHICRSTSTFWSLVMVNPSLESEHTSYPSSGNWSHLQNKTSQLTCTQLLSGTQVGGVLRTGISNLFHHWDCRNSPYLWEWHFSHLCDLNIFFFPQRQTCQGEWKHQTVGFFVLSEFWMSNTHSTFQSTAAGVLRALFL